MLTLARIRRELEETLEELETTSTSDGRGRRVLEEWELEEATARQCLEEALDEVGAATTALRLADKGRRTAELLDGVVGGPVDWLTDVRRHGIEVANAWHHEAGS